MTNKGIQKRERRDAQQDVRRSECWRENLGDVVKDVKEKGRNPEVGYKKLATALGIRLLSFHIRAPESVSQGENIPRGTLPTG